MTNYENLLDVADSEDVSVSITPHFSGTRIKGLYIDQHIALNTDLNTTAERACVLAEELGHHFTTYGIILEQAKSSENRKQELRARLYGYNKLIGIYGIVSAYKVGCRNLYEMADHLDVTEEYLKEALDAYRSKYGVYTKVDNYVIYFEPNLCVLELTQETYL